MTVSPAQRIVAQLNSSPAAQAGSERVQVLGLEDLDEHEQADDDNGLPTPRPIGVRPGMPWEPRKAKRSPVVADWTSRLLQALDVVPWLQDVAAGAIKLVAPLYSRNDTPVPDDVAEPAGAWKFAAIGDYGAGTPNLARVASNLAKSGADLIITAGDNVYPTGRWEDYRKNWEPFIGPVARKIPFMPALGNHDGYKDDLRPYFGHFPHLQGLPYYTYSHRNAQFFALDGDQDLRPGSAQRAWLEQELKSSKSRWKVVYLHYPMLGTKLNNEFAEIRESIQPLLARYGVQLVVAGHEHNYIRSQPIDGVVHILTGGGGQRVYPFTSKQADHIARRAAVFHHVEVSVTANQMIVRAIDEFGRRIDTAVIPYTGVTQAREGAALAGKKKRSNARIGADRLHVTPKPWPGLPAARG